MAGPFDLTGQNIENTYQRVLQTPDGVNIYDGTGSAFTFTAVAAAGGSNTQIQFNSASLLSGSSNLKFDYTNNNVILTGSILMSGSSAITGVDYIDFDTTASIATSVGRLHWNDVDGTLELGLKGGVVSSELGQGLVTRVVNKTSPLIDLLAVNYQVVVIGGAQGQRLSIRLAQANNDANSAGTLGVVAENIARNQEGFVVTVGLLKNRDTTGALQGETWNDGDILYLSPTVAGQMTNIKPQAPNHTVIVGYVEYAHQNNGKIYVKIDNGYELDELHNVKINTASLSYGDLLMYDSNVWYNTKTLSGSYTLSGSLTTNDKVNVQTLTASFISASGGITGSLFGTASWAQSASQALTASYTPNALITASVNSNTITFTKGDTSQFSITVNTGSGGTPAPSDTFIQYNSGSSFGANSTFKFNYLLQSLNQGNGNSATGQYSHAQGSKTTAGGISSHAEGTSTIASGDYSHAEGENTTAFSNGSHAAGYYTIASGSYQSVIGQYNVSSTSQSAFIIGDGTADNKRHNILFVYQSQFEVDAKHIYLKGLNNTVPQSSVLTYDSSTGEVFYTASSAFGGGGGGDFVPSAWTGSSTSQFAGTASFAFTASYFDGVINGGTF